MKVPTVLVYVLTLAGSFMIQVTNAETTSTIKATTHSTTTNGTTIGSVKTTMTMPSKADTRNDPNSSNATSMTPTNNTPPRIINVAALTVKNINTNAKPLNATSVMPSVRTSPLNSTVLSMKRFYPYYDYYPAYARPTRPPRRRPAWRPRKPKRKRKKKPKRWCRNSSPDVHPKLITCTLPVLFYLLWN